MSDAQPDIATTLFTLPPDAKFLPVCELSARLRAAIGPVEAGQSVITRPGFRVTTRLVPGPLAELIAEFRTPSRLTDAVFRFARAQDQDPFATLDLAFDALATLVEARILVSPESPDASAPAPSLAAGQEFAGFEIEALVRSLADSEVYRARSQAGASAALKISRDDRPGVIQMIANEVRILERLGGAGSPALLDDGAKDGRAYVAMDWCDGVSIAVAAQTARAARDRRRLHALVGRMFEAYGRLHRQGVLHGDIHPGNCLVRDDGRIVILDFGSARSIEKHSPAVDLMRSGIPQFYDPQMAEAVLAGRLPLPVTQASEQYALAVLAYRLLTGLPPVDAPAVQDELLRRIVHRPMLPLAARGVAAWPEVEAVLARALAKQPSDRFADVASLAHAFSLAGMPPTVASRPSAGAERAFDTAVEAVRSLESLTEPAHLWFALRAAMALEDAELLAAADVLVRRAGPHWAVQCISALVARARSDSRMESRAIAGFLAAAGRLRDGPQAAMAVLAAASVLDGNLSRSADSTQLADWAVRRLEQLMSAPSSAEARTYIAQPLLTYVALSLAKTGAVGVRADLPARTLSAAKAGNVWLWALAYDVFADDRFKALALAARLPRNPLRRGFALLRLHQLTGDSHWIAAVRGVVAGESAAPLPALDTALLMAELKAPEGAILPPYLYPTSGGRPRRVTAPAGRALQSRSSSSLRRDPAADRASMETTPNTRSDNVGDALTPAPD